MTVYLDHAATTPLRAEARDAWLDASLEVGNPSSIHGAGQRARRILEDARERLAATLECDPVEVVLTSGGTESINLAIRGLFHARRDAGAGSVIVVPDGEHHATLDTVAALERETDAVARWVGIDASARVRVDEWTRALGPDVAIATMLAANNEIGTLQPVEEAIAAAVGVSVPVHVDAVGTFGHVPLSFRSLRSRTGSGEGAGLAALSVAGHKLGGPRGIGAVVVGRDIALRPLLHGGGQQRGLRPGTADPASAVAFAVAAELAVAEMEGESTRLARLRDRLAAGIHDLVPEAIVSGDDAARLPGHLNVRFPGAQGDSLLLLLDMADIAVSTGSACQAGVPEPSHVLLAMGAGPDDARSVLRVTLGRTTTQDEVERLLAVLPDAYDRAKRAGMATRRVRAE